jgi:hypothetical protein
LPSTNEVFDVAKTRGKLMENRLKMNLRRASPAVSKISP